MPLLNLPDLHYLWIRLLVSSGSGNLALVLLRVLGYGRWALQFRKRQVITDRYRKLALVAKRAGLVGPLTETPPAELTKSHFISRAILGAAPAIVASTSPSFLSTFVTCENLASVEEEAVNGQGMVIAGTHFGSLGITPAVLASRGQSVTILRDQSFAKLADSRHGRQFFFGAQPLFLDSANPESVNKALLNCSRALRRGSVVAYTADAGHGTRTVKGMVLGHEVVIRTALVELASRGRCAVVYGFSYVSGGRVKVWLSNPVQLNAAGDLNKWCHNFCHDWERMLVEHPEAISWHRTDLCLIQKIG